MSDRDENTEILPFAHGMHDNDLRHTAVSSSDNPVLVDQRSSTEVESPTILGVRKCFFIKVIVVVVRVILSSKSQRSLRLKKT